MRISDQNITNSLQTAVILFTRSGPIEARSKNFGQASGVFNELNSHAINTIEQANLTYYVVNETVQEGKTFGERFINSIDQIFKIGYKNVIAIGNDSPELSSEHIRQAAHNLVNGKCTLGPSMDGGFYLLGISDLAFAKAKKQAITEIKWQSSSTLSDLKQLLFAQELKISILETLRDIDTIADVRRILKASTSIPSELRDLLILLTTGFTSLNEICHQIHISQFQTTYFNKGSPLSL